MPGKIAQSNFNRYINQTKKRSHTYGTTMKKGRKIHTRDRRKRIKFPNSVFVNKGSSTHKVLRGPPPNESKIKIRPLGSGGPHRIYQAKKLSSRPPQTGPLVSQSLYKQRTKLNPINASIKAHRNARNLANEVANPQSFGNLSRKIANSLLTSGTSTSAYPLLSRGTSISAKKTPK